MEGGDADGEPGVEPQAPQSSATMRAEQWPRMDRMYNATRRLAMRDRHTVALGRGRESRLTADSEKRKNRALLAAVTCGRFGRPTDELRGASADGAMFCGNRMLERARRRSATQNLLRTNVQARSVRERSCTSRVRVADSETNERRDLRTRLPGAWTQAKRERFLADRRDALAAHPSKADAAAARDNEPEPPPADAGGTLAHLVDQIAALEERLAAEGGYAPDVRDMIARLREHVADLHRRQPGRRGRPR